MRPCVSLFDAQVGALGNATHEFFGVKALPFGRIRVLEQLAIRYRQRCRKACLGAVEVQFAQGLEDGLDKAFRGFW